MGNKQTKDKKGIVNDAAKHGGGPAGDGAFSHYAFPFENAVFEGGPMSNLWSYIGAVRVLEECGVWRIIIRLAGSGSGALLATLLSVGYSSSQLEKFFQTDLRALSLDHGCGTCCLSRNLSSTFGWNQNAKLISWLGAKIATCAGKSDITFQQAFEKFGRELCVVVTNVSHGCVEYLHHKTSPNLSIVTAVRMSLSNPGLHAPVRHKPFREELIYIEGGLLCNYPVNCFDGWWLSLTPDDSFVHTLTSASQLPLSLDGLQGFLDLSRFTKYNNKTLGFVVYDESSGDSWTAMLDERNNLKEKASPPQTTLAKSSAEDRLACKSIEDKYNKFATAANKILNALGEKIPDQKKLIEKAELGELLKKLTGVTSEELETFFAGKSSPDDICQLVAPQRTGQVCRLDFLNYVEKTTTSYESNHRRWRHYPNRTKIRNLTDYLEAVELTAMANNRRLRNTPQDLDRTVGINIRYISGLLRNEKLQEADRTFLIEQGKLSTKAFLDHHINQGLPPTKESPSRRSFCRDDLPSFIDDDVSEIIDERDYMENLIGKVL